MSDKSPKNPALMPKFEAAMLAQSDSRDVSAVTDGINMLGEILESEPDFAYGYFYRATALLIKGQTMEALADFEKAIALDIDEADAYYSASMIVHLRNDLSKAKEYLEYVMEHYPQKTIAVSDYGNMLFEEGNFKEAMKYFDKALALGVEDYALFLRRGAFYMDDGDYMKAIDLLTKAKIVNPTGYIVYYYRGNCYYAAGNYQDALEDYDKCSFLNVSFPDVYYKMGCVNYELGNFDKAVENFTMMTSMLPESEVGYFSIGLAALGKDDFDMAIEQLEKSISIFDKDGKVYYLLSQAYLGKGEDDKSAAALTKAVELGFEIPQE